MSRSTPPVLAAVETVSLALIGAAAELHRCVPRLIGERRTKFDQQVTLARFLGQMAVNQAQSEIRRRMVTVPSQRGAGATPVDVVQQVVPVAVDVATTTAASDLAIDQYDELSASQVIGRLTHLDADELDAVYRYESEHRRRRTVLGRVEQLRATAR